MYELGYYEDLFIPRLERDATLQNVLFYVSCCLKIRKGRYNALLLRTALHIPP